MSPGGHVKRATGQQSDCFALRARIVTKSYSRRPQRPPQWAEPLADEPRSRAGPIEIQETLAKIVDAAQSDVATQLGSLEETVLTLAEALRRPRAPQIPAPREASRDGSRDASRDASREGSRI